MFGDKKNRRTFKNGVCEMSEDDLIIELHLVLLKALERLKKHGEMMPEANNLLDKVEQYIYESD
jgi:hypothetical protein